MALTVTYAAMRTECCKCGQRYATQLPRGPHRPAPRRRHPPAVSRPRHPIADVGLIGGGQVPTPGEVSRAHHGVLCLEARPECRRHGLEVLRQPLEERVI